MLDPWIIEQIRRREEDERRHRHERPTVEMPEFPPVSRRDHDRYDEDREEPPSDRGVVIIDYGV